MGGSRTIKTLVALFIAMTLGSLTLMLLETEPIRPTAEPLVVLRPPPQGAAAVVYDTQTALRSGIWRYVVVHSSRDPAGDLARSCHFMVLRGPRGEGIVRATDLWRQQLPGRHVAGVWREGSVGVCLVGEFAREGPETGQFDSLVDLVNTVQELCGVPADRVYLHSDLDARSSSPGPAFPAAKFSSCLLRP